MSKKYLFSTLEVRKGKLCASQENRKINKNKSLVIRLLNKDLSFILIKKIFIGGRVKIKRCGAIHSYIIKGEYIYLPYNYAKRIVGLEYVNKKYINIELSMNVKLRPKQIEARDTAMVYLKKTGSVTLALYTGFGKSIVSLNLAIALGVPILIICIGNILSNGWLNLLNKYTDARSWLVGSELTESVNIIVCPMSKMHMLSEEYLSNFGTVIIDEVHEMCTKIRIHKLLNLTPRYIIACSATPDKDDGSDIMYKYICGDHRVTVKDNRPLTIIKFNTGMHPDPNLKWEDLLTYLYHSNKRNNLVLDIVNNNPKKKILILTWRVSHVNILYDLLSINGKSVDFLHSSKTEYNDSDVLVGTVSKIGTGFDEENICNNFKGKRLNMVIFLSTSKSKNLITQAIGRVRRADNPSVVFFCDNSKIIRRHWTLLRKVFPNASYEHVKIFDQ
ncbi:MAG: hypothetical protein COA94_02310 [Rickettsiales bacterium]|nr:MAG: hypothetical protein COA94_02310 [Rickettsiales bacterium]